MHKPQADTQTSPHYCGDVAAVLVTYNPDLIRLDQAIRALLGQVGQLFIVDNGSANLGENWWVAYQQIASFGTKLHFLPQDDNHGIGAAHNIGIQAAQANQAAYVLLLDQDSVVAPEMVSRLRAAHLALRERGQRVAVVGPRYHAGENSSLSGFVRLGLPGFKHHQCNRADAVADDRTLVAADFLISSGSLIPAEALTTIGLMDADLFIDHLDTEWCLRAKAAGWQIYGVCNATMSHSLGENRRKVWFLRWRSVSFHQPFRYYYIIRNSLLLARRSYIPWRWKLANLSRCLQLFLFFGIISPHRKQCLPMFWRGLLDGLKNRQGRRDDLTS